MRETRVVYLEPGQLTIDSISLPDPRPNQVLVKTHQASVCGSERYHYQGLSVDPVDDGRGSAEDEFDTTIPGSEGLGQAEWFTYPMGPLGHEGGGTIVEAGSAVGEYLGGGKVKVGDRVGGLCFPTYTDYWVTDTKFLQPIPEGVSFEVGCLYEPLGCAAWAAIHMGVRLGDTVAVNGLGFAGNIMLQGAMNGGASQVVAIDPVPAKLEIARKLGASRVINPDAEDAVEVINELTHGVGVDVAVEAAGGNGKGLVQAFRMVRHNGTVALYGDNYTPVKEFCFHRFHDDAIKIRNLSPVHYSHLRSVEHMREAYRAVQRGVFDLDVIFEHSAQYRLDEIVEVFAKEAQSVESQGLLKTFIVP